MLNPKGANRVLAFCLPEGLARTQGRGARGADSFGQPRLGSEKQHLFCPSPRWSWEGAWLPAVIQAPPDLGALPLAKGAREGASLVRCKTRPGFPPARPHPFQGPTFQLFRRTSRPPQAPTCESATNTPARLSFGKPRLRPLALITFPVTEASGPSPLGPSFPLLYSRG